MGVGGLKKKAVFIDRDGVINQAKIIDGKPFPPCSLSDLEVFPGISSSAKSLKKKGFLLIIITNQPDVARGKTTKENVENINNYLLENFPFDQVFVCFHDDKNNCDCRKPLPGMLLSAAKDFCIDLNKSYMIGDRWKDIEAGHRAGCKTIMIKNNYNEKKPNPEPDISVKSFVEASNWILNTEINY